MLHRVEATWSRLFRQCKVTRGGKNASISLLNFCCENETVKLLALQEQTCKYTHDKEEMPTLMNTDTETN